MPNLRVYDPDDLYGRIANARKVSRKSAKEMVYRQVYGGDARIDIEAYAKADIQHTRELMDYWAPERRSRIVPIIVLVIAVALIIATAVIAFWK